MASKKKLFDIKLYKEPGADPIERSVCAGTTIEELLGEYRSHLPYRVITARVDGDDVALTYKIKKACEVVFCDIRDNTANRTFQRGLTLLYLTAVRDVFGEGAKVLIRNSVNRGIYTTIDTGKTVETGDGSASSAEAVKTGDGSASSQKTQNRPLSPLSPLSPRLPEGGLRQIEKRMWELVDKNIPIVPSPGGAFSLEGLKGKFYGIMPPSTGYIYSFALESMRSGVLLRFPHPSDPGKLSVYRRDARVFDAYDEEQVFLDNLGLGTIKELNQKIKKGGAEETIRVAEQRHESRLQDLAQSILDSGKQVVLIAGPSSSGKTTFSKRLIEAIEGKGAPAPLYLGTDDYFRDREFTPRDKKGDYNYEGLDAVDVELFAKNIGELLAGKAADLPKYDFVRGEKDFGERKLRLKKRQIIIVEGIHALNKKMSVGIDDGVKFKVYISPLTQLNIDDYNRVPSTDVRLIRRIIRDHRTRGSSVMQTLHQWPKVRAGESINIFPYNNEADEVFNSTLIYELPVLKKYVVPLLEEVRPGEAAYGHAKWLLYFLAMFSQIDDESAIPPESILREFIGGSKY